MKVVYQCLLFFLLLIPFCTSAQISERFFVLEDYCFIYVSFLLLFLVILSIIFDREKVKLPSFFFGYFIVSFLIYLLARKLFGKSGFLYDMSIIKMVLLFADYVLLRYILKRFPSLRLQIFFLLQPLQLLKVFMGLPNQQDF